MRRTILALAFLAAPALAAPPPKPPVGAVKLPTLSYTIMKSGPADGAHPARRDTITVNYTLTLLDGTVIDKSDEPHSFTLNKLIPAWQVLVPLMRPGDRWTLFVPPEYGYGATARGAMPANAFLIFDLELIASAPPAPAEPPKP